MRHMEEFFAHLKQLSFVPRTIVDVGVAWGTPGLYEAFPDAYYWLFEPVVDFEPAIQAILGKVRGEYHMVALADSNGEANIFVPPNAETASLMHRGLDLSDPRVRSVPTRTLDDVLAGTALAEPIMLKTDCQGADLNVLKGGRGFLPRCEVVLMEVGMFHYFDPSSADFTEVIQYMKTAGFVVYDLLNYTARPCDGALGQIDVAFVTETGRFRATHVW